MTAQDHNPILFLHGMGGSNRNWGTFNWWFQADGWPITSLYAENFANRELLFNKTFENIDNANRIKQWVEDILTATGAEKIDLISHSMGGYSSRYYIKFLGGIDKVDDYVSLGTPHHGAACIFIVGFGEVCLFTYPNELILTLNEGDETPGGILNDTIGDRFDPYWEITYNGTHIPGSVSYTSIYSRDDQYVPALSAPLDGANNTEVVGVGHDQLIMDWNCYKLARAAVEDTNGTYLEDPPPPPLDPAITMGILLIVIISVVSIVIVYYRRRRRK